MELTFLPFYIEMAFKLGKLAFVLHERHDILRSCTVVVVTKGGARGFFLCLIQGYTASKADIQLGDTVA